MSDSERQSVGDYPTVKALLAELHRLGVRRPEYNLASPYGHRSRCVNAPLCVLPWGHRGQCTATPSNIRGDQP